MDHHSIHQALPPTSLDVLESLKLEIDCKGSLLGETWTELSGVLTRYRAHLMQKHDELNSILSGDQAHIIQIYHDLERSEMERDELMKRTAELERELTDREEEISTLRTQVAMKNDVIQKLQMPDHQNLMTSQSRKQRKIQPKSQNQQTIGPHPSNLDPPSTPSSTVTTPDRTVVKQEPEDMPEPSGQNVFFTLDEVLDAGSVGGGSDTWNDQKPVVLVPGEVASATMDGTGAGRCDVTALQMESMDSGQEVNPGMQRAPTGEYSNHSCQICPQRSTEAAQLTEHVKTHTGEKPHHMCPVCHRRFVQVGSLISHMRTHTGMKPYCCPICQKQFRQSGHLAEHMRTHSGERPYSCSVCQMRFAKSNTLLTHMRIHTGEKPYECNVCHKRFPRSGNLVYHMRTHTGEKPYQCDVCGKCFVASCQRVKHMRTHTGEKPHECPVCGRRFTESSGLNRHLQNHTDEEPFACTMCPKRFTLSSALTEHMRTHTGDDETV